MTRTPSFANVALLSVALATSGCSVLPHAGPSARAMRHADSVEIVRVSPQVASQLAEQNETEMRRRVDDSLNALGSPFSLPEFRFGPGDVIKVAVWSYAGPGAGASALPSSTGAVTTSDLGTYTVSESGNIELPFIGTTHLTGMTIAQAQAEVSRRFAALHTLARPSAVIDLQGSPHDGVLVSGTIGAPKLVLWTPGGLSLARALTAAMGSNNTNAVLASGTSNLTPSQTVEVLRSGQAPVELPFSVALESRVVLHPGDRVIVKSQASLRVTLLGGGITKPNVYGFGDMTTLAQVIAQANGLNSATANTHGVYVLRQRQDEKPLLFDFAWSHVDGLISSQRFPMRDGDIVYVGEAPFTEVSKILMAAYSVAVPVQIAR